VNTKPEIEGTFDAFGLEIRCERNAPSNMAGSFSKHVLPGNWSSWDITLLLLALVNSFHQLLQCTAAQQEPGTAKCGECYCCKAQALLTNIRNLRNNDYGHVQQCGIKAEQSEKAQNIIMAFVKHCLPHKESAIEKQIGDLGNLNLTSDI